MQIIAFFLQCRENVALKHQKGNHAIRGLFKRFVRIQREGSSFKKKKMKRKSRTKQHTREGTIERERERERANTETPYVGMHGAMSYWWQTRHGKASAALEDATQQQEAHKWARHTLGWGWGRVAEGWGSWQTTAGLSGAVHTEAAPALPPCPSTNTTWPRRLQHPAPDATAPPHHTVIRNKTWGRKKK